MNLRKNRRLLRKSKIGLIAREDDSSAHLAMPAMKSRTGTQDMLQRVWKNKE